MKAIEILEKLSNVEGAEVFECHLSKIPVKFVAGALESVKRVEEAGRALRLIKGGRLGYATTTDLADSDGLIRSATESAQFGDQVSFRFPKKRPTPRVKRFDRAVEALNERELIAMGEELIDRIRSVFPDVKIDVSLDQGVEEISLMNTSGLELKDKRTSLTVGVSIERVREGDIFIIGAADSSRRLGRIDLEALADSIIQRLRWAERTVSVPTKPMPAVFTPHGSLVLLLPLFFGLNGQFVYLGSSPLRDKRGQVVFDKSLSLIDDGTLDFASRSAACDDEGTPTRRKVLIERGKVKQFLYDLRTAALAKERPTGNGSKERGLGVERDFRSPPGIAPTTWLITEGKYSFEQMISELDEGLLVDSVIGLGQGNILSGAFSNNVSGGYLIQKGQIVGRVKNTMIAGNIYELLKDKVRAISDRAEWVYGILKAPAICIDGLSVVSRG